MAERLGDLALLFLEMGVGPAGMGVGPAGIGVGPAGMGVGSAGMGVGPARLGVGPAGMGVRPAEFLLSVIARIRYKSRISSNIAGTFMCGFDFRLRSRASKA